MMISEKRVLVKGLEIAIFCYTCVYDINLLSFSLSLSLRMYGKNCFGSSKNARTQLNRNFPFIT